jgi:autotransporter-associated beta strand protein
VVGSVGGAGDVQLQGASLAVGGTGLSSRLDGVLSGTGSLIKQGSGSFTLTAANTYSGGTSIEAGTVRVGGAAATASLGSGAVVNQGSLSFDNSGPSTWVNPVSGSGSLVVTQGQVTLAAPSTYTGATQVNGGSLATSAAEQLPDTSAVQVAAGAQLTLAGNETMASLNAAGTVRVGGNVSTAGDQVYTGTLTVTNPQGVTLRGGLIDARNAGNTFGAGALGLNATRALINAPQALLLGEVTLANGGAIEAQRLTLGAALRVQGGSLQLKASAAPDDSKATPEGTAQVPQGGRPLAVAEATVTQGAGSAITVASGAELVVSATGGGSVLLNQDANAFNGSLSVLSGPAFGTAWVPNVRDALGIQSLIHIAGGQVNIGGLGVEGDIVRIRADGLRTSATATIAARLPFDDVLLGRAFSAPGLTLELRPTAFDQAASFGATNGQEIRVAVGTTATGNRSGGNNAGYITLLPKAGAKGSTAVFLVGPDVSLSPGGYRFFHDGASKPAEVPIVYNGVLPLTPQATGALSSINGDAEDARRARFQETVRTENVSSRLRSGVIAEVGAGRPATVGREGARPPETCEPAAQPALSCK